MDTEKVYTTSLRLYKNRPAHHQAYRYLKSYNKDIFKTKDDFVAEAIIYFTKYLQQEEELQQMKLLNTLLENQKEQFGKIVKEAVSQVQTEAFAETLKGLAEEFREKDSRDRQGTETRRNEETCTEKDLRFAEFYGAFED